MNDMNEEEKRYEATTPTQLDRIEWMLLQLLNERRGATGDEGGGEGESKSRQLIGEGELPHMTVKQHATLQLLLRGKSNTEIGEVLGVTDNTAKVHVRTIAKKFGVNTRAEICVLADRALRGVDEDTYKRLSGGLPADWAEKRELWCSDGEPDPYAGLYRNDVSLDEGMIDDEAD